MIRTALLLVVIAVQTGCSSMKLTDYASDTLEFQPEVFFLGKTRAYGFFQDRFGTIRREFTVDIDGRIEGDLLILDEYFDYADGEEDYREWRIRSLGDGRYEGTAGDIVGTASGEALGRAMRWRYDFDLVVNGSTWRVHFDDWMILQDENVMLNKSIVSKYGFTIGEVYIFFTRVDSVEESEIPQAAE